MMRVLEPLMKEHRLIEKFIEAMREEAEAIKIRNKINPVFVEIAIDFIKKYVEKTHYGKEEDILFKELKRKNLTPLHKKIMQDLSDEHEWALNKTEELLTAKNRYEREDSKKLDEIVDIMQELTRFYPKHILKEDQHFFIPIISYFSREEREKMLNEFWEFDNTLIHEKYEKVIEELVENR